MSTDTLATTDPVGPAPAVPPDESLPLAIWPERVIASLLDAALLFAVAYLVFPVQPVRLPDVIPGRFGNDTAATVASWTDSAWMIALVAGAVLAQAYLGSTPGKLAAGIAVVREADGRPAGLVRTLVRALAHVLDGILLIGYLRPLWHHRNQTFADSLARTVVLSTRRPLSFTGRPPAQEPPALWERPTTPAWRGVTRVVALIACAAAAAMSVASSTTSSAQSSSCTVLPAPQIGIFAFSGGTIDVRPATAVETRLGIERPKASSDPGIDVAWQWQGPVPTGEVELHATFERADGSDRVVVDRLMRDAVIVGDPGTPTGGSGIEVHLPIETLATLGDDWTWSLRTTTNGETSPECTSF